MSQVFYAPEDMWQGGCYYGGSATALQRLARAYGYSLVAFDSEGVNVFFVRDDVLGAPLPHHFEHHVTRVGPAFAPLHADCLMTPWVHVPDNTTALKAPSWSDILKPVLLTYNGIGPGGHRIFREARTIPALALGVGATLP